MEKKYVGIGIAALAAGTGAAVYKKKKIQNQKKEVQEHTRYEAYRNTERGKQVRNAKGIYYSRGNYEAFARPEKPEGIEEKSAYIVGSGLAALAAARCLENRFIFWKPWILPEEPVTVSLMHPEDISCGAAERWKTILNVSGTCFAVFLLWRYQRLLFWMNFTG